MALTRPSTIGVLSGFWEGNASTAPLARRRAAAVENSNKRVLLIPISFYSWAEEERTKPPPRYVTDGGNNTPSLRTGTSAGGSTSPGTLPHKQLPRPPSTRSSQNAGKTKFREFPFRDCMKSSWRSPNGGSSVARNTINRALWGCFLPLVGYRFDTYPEFSYSLGR